MPSKHFTFNTPPLATTGTVDLEVPHQGRRKIRVTTDQVLSVPQEEIRSAIAARCVARFGKTVCAPIIDIVRGADNSFKEVTLECPVEGCPFPPDETAPPAGE